MRAFWLSGAVIAATLIATGFTTRAQPYGGPGMWDGAWGMMRGYGPGYGHGYMMGPGYGPGMMYGGTYGPRGYYYGRGSGYRGERLCWKETDARGYGYYARCRN